MCHCVLNACNLERHKAKHKPGQFVVYPIKPDRCELCHIPFPDKWHESRCLLAVVSCTGSGLNHFHYRMTKICNVSDVLYRMRKHVCQYRCDICNVIVDGPDRSQHHLEHVRQRAAWRERLLAKVFMCSVAGLMIGIIANNVWSRWFH
jgi:hypothetical protein